MLVTWSVITVLRLATMLARTDSEHCHHIGTAFNCSRLRWNSFNASSFPENTTSIDLSSNNITTVPANMFSSLVNLRSINLENNSISEIDAEAFDGLVNLEAISLSNNNIEHVPQNLIFTNVNVTQIYLKNNTIIIPRHSPLLVSKSLKLLNLEWCNIDKLVSADVFSQLPQLQKLELNGNSLQNVNVTPFQPLIKRNVEIILDDNNTCSDSLRRTILQLQDQINFITDCKISITTTPITTLETIILKLQDQLNFTNEYKIAITTAYTTKLGATSELFQLPFDVTLLIAATTVVTCILVILLVVYMCFVHCSIYFEKRCQREHQGTVVFVENSTSLEVVASEVLPPVQDPSNNGGYEQPMPQTEEDIIRNLPNMCKYITIIDDNRPIHSSLIQDDNFSKNTNQFDNCHDSSMKKETLAPEIGFRSAQSRRFNDEKYLYEPIANSYVISPVANTRVNDTGALSDVQVLHLGTEKEDLQRKKQTLLRDLKTKMDSVGPPERFQDDGGVRNRPLPLLPLPSSSIGRDRRKGTKTRYHNKILDCVRV